MYETESCDGELTYQELAASYKELYTRSVEVCELLEKQKKTISLLHAERSDHLPKIFDLNDKVTQLNSQLEHLKKQVRMMNTGIDLLEEILEGQNQGKPKAIGFDYRALNKQQQNQDKKFFPVVGTYDTTMSKPMSQHPKEHQSSKSKGISRPLRCHNCGRCGHIRSYCYKLYGYP